MDPNQIGGLGIPGAHPDEWCSKRFYPGEPLPERESTPPAVRDAHGRMFRANDVSWQSNPTWPSSLELKP